MLKIKNLFNHFYIDDYVPHVRHTAYAVLYMAAGYVCIMKYSWMTFGVTLFILGILLFIVIGFGIAWRAPIAYWEQIENTIKVMLRINSPEIWFALGFKEVPNSQVTVIEKKIDEHGIYAGETRKLLSADTVMLNTISNKILLSGKADFTEESFKGIVPNFRKIKKDFEAKGYIRKSTKHPKSGFVVTKKFMDEIVYQYADKAIKLQIEKENKNG